MRSRKQNFANVVALAPFDSNHKIDQVLNAAEYGQLADRLSVRPATDPHSIKVVILNGKKRV